jgi:DNA-binding transcriptional ArsR family regulator
MQDFLAITKALSDENRVRILMALGVGELCVCQIIELLQLAPSTISKHMVILKQAKLVDAEKNGKWVYYRLPSTPPRAAAEAIDWAMKHVLSDAAVKRDARALSDILRQHPVDVCRRQKVSRSIRAELGEAKTAMPCRRSR